MRLPLEDCGGTQAPRRALSLIVRACMWDCTQHYRLKDIDSCARSTKTKSHGSEMEVLQRHSLGVVIVRIKLAGILYSNYNKEP